MCERDIPSPEWRKGWAVRAEHKKEQTALQMKVTYSRARRDPLPSTKETSKLPQPQVISEVNVARWRRWVHTFLFLFVSISFAFYVLFDMLKWEHLSFIVYLLLFLSFIVSVFFSVYWDNLIEMKCNEIAFRWTWYNMNVTATLIPGSWLGILNWMTWFVWRGGWQGEWCLDQNSAAPSCLGSWQEVDRHMRLGNVDKQGEMQTTDSSWYSLTPTSWASTSTPQQGLKKSGCFLLRWHLPSEIDQ